MGLDLTAEQEQKLAMKKEIYVQTQNWARHNETLIIAANTVLLGAIAAISTIYFRQPNEYTKYLMCLPQIISALGLLITFYLSRQYNLAISRVVVYEKYFNMHDKCDAISEATKDYSIPWAEWGNTFVPKYLHNAPVYARITGIFFYAVHILILGFSFILL